MTPEEIQQFLTNETEACKRHTLIIADALERCCYEVADFTDIDQYLKYAEGSIKRARKIIKHEKQGREANRKRQIEKTKKT